jgi:hypothetical protein
MSGIESQQDKIEQQEQANKDNFENNYWSDKRIDTKNNPNMDIIAKNYTEWDPDKTVKDVINNIAWNQLSQLNNVEREQFREIRKEFIAELEFDESWKLTAEWIMEMAENIAELKDLLWTASGSKWKALQETWDAVDKTHQKEIEKSKKSFAEKIADFIKQVAERKQKEQEQRAENVMEINNAWTLELAQSWAEAENIFRDWPPHDMSA